MSITLKPREKNFLYAAVLAAAAALLYGYVLEPCFPFLAMRSATRARYRNYAALLDRKSGMKKALAGISASPFWKKLPEEQQVAMLQYLEKLGRSVGISEIVSIRPGEIRNDPPFKEIAAQMEARMTLASAAQFLYQAGTGPFPLRVQKLQMNGEENDARRIKMQVTVSSLWMPGEGR